MKGRERNVVFSGGRSSAWIHEARETGGPLTNKWVQNIGSVIQY